MTMIELKSDEGSVWIRPENVEVIDFQLEAGCYVYCGDVRVLVTTERGHELLSVINGDDDELTDDKKQSSKLLPIWTDCVTCGKEHGTGQRADGKYYCSHCWDVWNS